jgi:hypothetical protein
VEVERGVSNELVTQVRTKLPRTPFKTPKENTAAIREALQEIAISNGLQIYPCRDSRRREFLTDFVLYHRHNGRTRFGFSALAVESEMSHRNAEAILHDFDKLVHLKSRLKLFAFRTNPKQSRKVRDGIEDQLRVARDCLSTETYLILEYGMESEPEPGNWYKCEARPSHAGKLRPWPWRRTNGRNCVPV